MQGLPAARMVETEVLDIHGIDALLSRFRLQKEHQEDLERRPGEWDRAQPSLLSDEALRSVALRFRVIGERIERLVERLKES